MVTLEEAHSTRGRAHMLFEMLQGEVIRGGWENENVKESLELCLSCKACKSECPANVDIATTKRSFCRIITKRSGDRECLRFWPGGAVGTDRFGHPRNRKLFLPGTGISSPASKTLGLSSAAAIAATGDNEL